MSDAACPSCGALVGGVEGCQRLLESLGLREYEDMRVPLEVVRRASHGSVRVVGGRSRRAGRQRRLGAALAQGTVTCEALWVWASSVWDAYTSLHVTARTRIAAA